MKKRDTRNAFVPFGTVIDNTALLSLELPTEVKSLAISIISVVDTKPLSTNVEPTGASFNFNPIRSTEGNYGILSGDFMAGKKNADGNDAFHSGFNTYAQMGGSMMQNLKEGDEVYLTEEQIDQIIKRGGKLSYL